LLTNKILLTIKIVLVVLLGLVLIELRSIWQVPTDSSAAPNIDSINNGVNDNDTPPQTVTNNYQSMLDTNLFGSNEKTTYNNTTENATPKNVTALDEPDLELQGTITGPVEIARAIIHNKANSTTDTYKIGDKIGNADIVAINKKSIEVIHNGKRKNLSLRNASSPIQPEYPIPLESENDRGQFIRHKATHDTINRNSIIEELIQNAQIETYIVDDKPSGLRLANLDDVNLPAFVGLQQGDIIEKFALTR